ncbi:hypothetical protein KY285_020596 [Solanum tuberosum]|nr:hypothetical protein KY285_020596 [Solanum tuberosum]
MFHKGTTFAPSANMAGQGKIQNVLYVSSFKMDLLSVAKLTRESNCVMKFYPDLHIGQVKEIGKMIDEMYHLKSRGSIQHSVATYIASINNDIWHKRLGHVPLKMLFSGDRSLSVNAQNIDEGVVDVDLFVVIRDKSIKVCMSLPMPHPLVDSAAQETLTIVMEHVKTSPSAEPRRRSKILNLMKSVAMNQELQALADNKTWSLTHLPTEKREIGSKWVFKSKYNDQGQVDRYKARLVAKGYTQLLVKMVTIRVVLTLAAK